MLGLSALLFFFFLSKVTGSARHDCRQHAKNRSRRRCSLYLFLLSYGSGQPGILRTPSISIVSFPLPILLGSFKNDVPGSICRLSIVVDVACLARSIKRYIQGSASAKWLQSALLASLEGDGLDTKTSKKKKAAKEPGDRACLSGGWLFHGLDLARLPLDTARFDTSGHITLERSMLRGRLTETPSAATFFRPALFRRISTQMSAFLIR